MKRSEKETFVTAFRDRLGRAPAVFLTDFTGLDVKSITQLRRNLRGVGAEYVVVKNRLARRAVAEEDGFPDLGDALLGPTGVVFGYEDAVGPAKAVAEFAKDHEDRPVFKLGVLDNEILAPAQIGRLAKLPSREQLLAELAGALEAPLAMFAAALGAKLQETAGLLEALRREKEQDA